MRDVNFYLRTLDAQLTEAWYRHFAGVAAVEADTGDIFGRRADAVVSPANSFGDMTGGIDALFRRRFGTALQDRLQALIRDEHDGELLVGQAVIVSTGDEQIPYLISAPTMRVPLKIAGTVNAYLAFRAVLRAVRDFNRLGPGGIRSVLCPGLGTGTGELPADVCARQMRAAYDHVVIAPPRYKDLNEALVEHYRQVREDR